MHANAVATDLVQDDDNNYDDTADCAIELVIVIVIAVVDELVNQFQVKCLRMLFFPQDCAQKAQSKFARNR